MGRLYSQLFERELVSEEEGKMSSVPMEIIGANTSNPTQKAVNTADPSISYVNTGLERWKAMREKWVKKREDESPKEIQRKYTNPLNLLLSKLPNGTSNKKKAYN